MLQMFAFAMLTAICATSASRTDAQARSLIGMDTHRAPYQTTAGKSLLVHWIGVNLPVSVVFALQAIAVANAQTPNESGATVGDPCLAEPKHNQDTLTDNDQELTEKLDRCNGVLKPPPAEDQEIEAQPPETGKTPVIPPGELPEQQPETEEPD